MAILDLTSQITFIYVDNLQEATEFFSDDLGLELTYDPGWAKVWRTGAGAFVGAVNIADGSIEVAARGGFLISLTVRNVHEVHAHLTALNKYSLSPIKKVQGIGLESFFFKGPAGYDFEVQQFTAPELIEVF